VDDVSGEGEYHVAAPGNVVGVAFVSATRSTPDKPWQWRQVSLEVDKASLEQRRAERAAAAKAGGYGSDTSAASRPLNLADLPDATLGRRAASSGAAGAAEREVYVFNIVPGSGAATPDGAAATGDSQLR
jgi:hypothetical protein